jgi:ketosteroid isomerase-like protein
MSVDRVDVIERSYRAFRDDDVEALLALYHPEAVWDMTHWEGFPDAQAYRGLAGIEEVIRTLRDVFGELDVRPVQIREAGPNRVLVKGALRIRGRTSGAEVDAPPFAQIIEFRDERIVRVENYTDVDAARQAAGLTGL